MEYLEATRTFLGDAFWALPVLLMGFFFLYGSVTSNVGLILLAIGELILGNIASDLSNKTNWFNIKDNSQLAWNAIQFTTEGILFFLSIGYMLLKWSGDSAAWSVFVCALLPIIGCTAKPSVSFFDSLGIFPAFIERSFTSSKGCSLLPTKPVERETIDNTFVRPTSWTTHIVFLYGFLMANASALFATPKPVVQNIADLDKKTADSKQFQIDTRYENRRFQTGLLMAILTLILLVLLGFRYYATPCEEIFWTALPALLFTSLLGASWYTFTTGECGVLSTDILGFAAGMKSPDLAENPIVCIGTA